MSDTPVAFVTGASRGIGRCGALALARAGYDVVITARTVHEGEGRARPSSSAPGQEPVPVAGSLDTTASEIEAVGQRVLPVPMDLMDTDSVLAAVDTALAEWGRIDALVNNAIYQGPGSMDRIGDLPLDAAETMIFGNYLQQLRLTQRALPHLLERDRSYVITMASGSAYLDPPGPAGSGGWGVAYAASKAAVGRMAGVLHAEFADRGLLAFNVDPGFIITERMRAQGGQRHLEENFRGAAPEIPGAAIGWLASNPQASEYAGQLVRAQKLCKQLGLLAG